MSTLCRAGGFLRSFYPVSVGFISKPSAANGVRSWKNAVVVRACSGSVLQRIEKKQEEAIVGGGQKRIDTQHRKVRFKSSLFKSFSFLLIRDNFKVGKMTM